MSDSINPNSDEGFKALAQSCLDQSAGDEAKLKECIMGALYVLKDTIEREVKVSREKYEAKFLKLQELLDQQNEVLKDIHS